MNNYTNATVEHDYTADKLVGTLYIVVSLFLLGLYIPTLYILLKDQQSMQLPCFKLMVSMGVFDICQVIGFGFVAGIFTLAGSTGGFLCNRIWGSINDTCWIINCLQGNILAFDRFVKIWFSDWHDYLFKGKRVYVWILVAFIYGVSINAMYVSQQGDMVYDLANYIWYYTTNEANHFCLLVEIVQDYVNELMSLIFFLFIALKLKQLRSATTANHLSKKDKMAIYQACWISLSLMFMNSIYFGMVSTTTNKWAIFCGNFLLILVNGQTPIVFMVFNSALRKEMFGWGRKMVGLGSNGVVSTLVIPINHAHSVGPSTNGGSKM